MNKNFIIGGAILLVIGLAVAIGVTLSSEPVAAPLPEGETTINGEYLPKYAGENDDNVAVGLPGPTFSGPNENSDIVSLEKDGNAKALLFLAHWCPHCQREVPRVSKWLEENGVPSEIEILAVSTAVREGTPNYPPSEWFIKERWPTDIFVDNQDNDLAAAYGLAGFPYWVLVDATGRVVHRSSGELTEEQFGYLVELAISLAPKLA